MKGILADLAELLGKQVFLKSQRVHINACVMQTKMVMARTWSRG